MFDSSFEQPFRGLPFEVRAMIWDLCVPEIDAIMPYCGSKDVPRPTLSPQMDVARAGGVLDCFRVGRSCQEARAHTLTALFIRNRIVLKGNPYHGIRNLAAMIPAHIRQQVKEVTLESPQQSTAWASQYRPPLSDDAEGSDFLSVAAAEGFTLRSVVMQAQETGDTESWMQDFTSSLLHGSIDSLSIGPFKGCAEKGCELRCRAFTPPVVKDKDGRLAPPSWGTRCPHRFHNWKRRFETIATDIWETTVGENQVSDLYSTIDSTWAWFADEGNQLSFQGDQSQNPFQVVGQLHEMITVCESLYPLQLEKRNGFLVIKCDTPDAHLRRITGSKDSAVDFDDQQLQLFAARSGISIPSAAKRLAQVLTMNGKFESIRRRLKELSI